LKNISEKAKMILNWMQQTLELLTMTLLALQTFEQILVFIRNFLHNI